MGELWRVGRFKTGRIFILSDTEYTWQIFNKLSMIVLKTDWDPSSDEITYLGISPLFDEIEMGQTAPEYLIHVTTEEGVVTEVKAERK